MSEFTDKFLLIYIIFAFFMTFLFLNGVDFFSDSFNLDPPVYIDIGSGILSDLFEFSVYIVSYANFFWQMFTISSTNQIVATLVYGPMVLYLIYIFIFKILLPIIRSVPLVGSGGG